jgi:hypothetical protein
MAAYPLNYCLLDATRMLEHMEVAKELNPQHDSLYRGRSEEALTMVAPYLFTYQEGTDFAIWLAEKGWGDAWGVFLFANATLDELHKHFQKFMLVKTEDGQELYFRFYDPRVLRAFLPTCNWVQIQELFGPVQYFVVEDEDPAFAIVFTVQKGYFQTIRVAVKEMNGQYILPFGR